jgi:hypothetical protein
MYGIITATCTRSAYVHPSSLLRLFLEEMPGKTRNGGKQDVGQQNKHKINKKGRLSRQINMQLSHNQKPDCSNTFIQSNITLT